MDKEAIARIIDPKGWEYHDDHLRRAEKWEAEGKPADHALVGGYRNHAAYNVAESLAKATAILALQSSERGEVARITAWDAAENEIARVSSEVSFADTVPEAKRDGVKVGIDLCLAAIRIAASKALRDIPLSSYATLSPAEPSPESREGAELASNMDEMAQALDRQGDKNAAYFMRKGASAIRALKGPLND